MADTDIQDHDPAPAKGASSSDLFIRGSRDNVLKPIQAVSGVVQKKHTLPVLSNILIKQKDETVTFVTTDLDIQITTEGNIGAPGSEFSTTVSAKKLCDILSSLPESSEVSLYSSKEFALLKSGRSKFELQTIKADEFPEMRLMAVEKAFTIPCDRFKYLLNMVSFACAINNVRYFLTGVYVCSEGTSIRGVATDGHRLSLCNVEATEGSDKKFETIIPKKTVKELLRLLPDSQDPLVVSIAEKQIKFEFSSITVISKVVEGRYPDYEKVIPKDNDKKFSVLRQELHAALQRVAILTADKLKGVRWNLSEDNLKVAATNADMEEAEDEIAVSYTGEPLEIGFNVTYLIEALNVLKNDSVRISLGDSMKPALIEMPESESYKFVVMPMKI